MSRISLKIRKSNWETVAFLIIHKFLRVTGKKFYRIELMRAENIDNAVDWLKQLNHKKYPKHPEETLQRTIQNLRDKGFIVFHGQGEYELTKAGVEECRRVASEFGQDIDEAIELRKEDHKTELLEEVKKMLKEDRIK